MTNDFPYPYRDGDFYAIGPGIMSTTERPEAGTVINWVGENFTVPPAPAPKFGTLTGEELAVIRMALGDWAREHRGMPNDARLIALDVATRLGGAA